MTDSKHEMGKQRIQEVLGEKADEIIAAYSHISPDYMKYVVDFAYGDLYTRKNFSDKHRELAAVACLIGQGNAGLPLRAHLNGMLNVGWKKEEILELFIFLIGYIGFPSVAEALEIFKEIIESKKL